MNINDEKKIEILQDYLNRSQRSLAMQQDKIVARNQRIEALTSLRDSLIQTVVDDDLVIDSLKKQIIEGDLAFAEERTSLHDETIQLRRDIADLRAEVALSQASERKAAEYNVKLTDENRLTKRELKQVRDAAAEAHSLLGELMPGFTGDMEKEMYRVFDLLRYALGIYDYLHTESKSDQGE